MIGREKRFFLMELWGDWFVLHYYKGTISFTFSTFEMCWLDGSKEEHEYESGDPVHNRVRWTRGPLTRSTRLMTLLRCFELYELWVVLF